jgi:RimJ/RimL family protein N-acetyltransferase
MDVIVRRLEASDAGAYQHLRLEALRTEPAAFSSNVETEAQRSLAEVAARIASPEANESFVVGAFDTAASLIGVGGFYRESAHKMRHIGWIWGMFVAPRARAQGIARRILGHVLHDVREIPELLQIQLRVVTANANAQRLYESFGFRQIALLPRALRIDGEFYDDALMLLTLER